MDVNVYRTDGLMAHAQDNCYRSRHFEFASCVQAGWMK